MGLSTLGQTEIIRTFIALALLLGSAFLFGTLIEKIKGPRVVGEILGGMIIGGSGLFLIFPDFMNSIFSAYPEEGKVLNVFYQMGLIFLMFLSGFSTRIEVDRKNSKIITLVFFGATVLPMLGSIPYFNLFQEYFRGDKGNVFSYRLVFAIGVAITSIPVISKIFFDMGVMNTGGQGGPGGGGGMPSMPGSGDFSPGSSGTENSLPGNFGPSGSPDAGSGSFNPFSSSGPGVFSPGSADQTGTAGTAPESGAAPESGSGRTSGAEPVIPDRAAENQEQPPFAAGFRENGGSSGGMPWITFAACAAALLAAVLLVSRLPGRER